MNTTTATTGNPITMPTAEAMLAAFRAHGFEPFAELMLKHGANPATHILVLPQGFRISITYWTPSYVRFSEHVTAPTFVRRMVIGLPQPTF